MCYLLLTEQLSDAAADFILQVYGERMIGQRSHDRADHVLI
jgi:hypothetical protein